MHAPDDRTNRLGFDLTEDQRMVRDTARAFARDRLAPRAAERDRDKVYPHDLMPELAELGLLAMKVSPDDGGGGTDNVGYVLAMEAIAEACASTAVILASSNLATKILGDYAHRLGIVAGPPTDETPNEPCARAEPEGRAPSPRREDAPARPRGSTNRAQGVWGAHAPQRASHVRRRLSTARGPPDRRRGRRPSRCGRCSRDRRRPGRRRAPRPSR